MQPTAKNSELAQQLGLSAALNPSPKPTTINASSLKGFETVTLDEKYDLTLHVGTNGKSKAPKSFRINSNMLRMVSQPFKAMLSGAFAETTQSEIEFPDDSSHSFELVLNIMHYKVQKLPATLSKIALVDLAIFCDKYDVSDIVAPFVLANNWLGGQKGEDQHWQLSSDLQDYLLVAHVFKLEGSRDLILSLLVMNVAVHKEDQHQADQYLFYISNKNQKVNIRASLPDALIKKIREQRLAVLEEIRVVCNQALNVALGKTACKYRSKSCIALQVGVLVKTYQGLGLFPHRSNASSMHDSICSYGDAFGKIREDYLPSAKNHRIGGSCNWDECFQPNSVTQRVRQILRKHLHPELLKQWANIAYLV